MMAALFTVACGATESNDCTFAATIDSASCALWDNPDPFGGDSWFIDLSGTAHGPAATEFAASQLAIQYLGMIACSTTCANWSGGANFTCANRVGEGAETKWTARMEVLPSMSESSRTFDIVAKVSGIQQTPCDGAASATRTVTCTR